MVKIVAIEQKIWTANEVLGLFAPGTTIKKGDRGWLVEWSNYHGNKYERYFSTISRGSHHPKWHRKWGHGGTSCAALTMLVRWLRGEPVYSLAIWRCWSSPGYDLFRGQGDRAISLLLLADYPEKSRCIKCDHLLTGGVDWLSEKGSRKAGPGCFGGCRR